MSHSDRLMPVTGTRVIHVCPDELGSVLRIPFDPRDWHRAREMAHDVCEQACIEWEKSKNEHVVVLVDDNHHLKSMRRAYFKLARDRMDSLFLLV